MKKMNITLIATICFVVIFILVAGVLSYQLMTTTRASGQPKTLDSYKMPSVQDDSKKPNTSLSAGKSIVTPTPQSFTGSLQSDLNSTIDDGGQSDLDTIKAEASKL